MKRVLRALLIFCVSLSSANLALAQTTATWNFNTNLAVSTAPTGATGSSFSVATVTGNNTSNLYRTTGWTTSGSISLTQYYEVTVTPTGGNRMDFTTFVFDQGGDSNGPTDWAVRSSVDTYGSNLGAATFARGANVSGNSVDISGLTNQTGAVTFRIYCWNANNGSGQFDLDNVNINGKIYNATQPSSASLIDFTATAVTTEMQLNWTDGDGNSRIVVGNIGGTVGFTPVDGTSLGVGPSLNITTASLGGNDRLLSVGATGAAGILVTNLVAGTRYHFRVYESNGSGSQANYNTASATFNPVFNVQRTPSSSLILTPLTATTMQVNWTNGNGNLAPNRIVVAKASGPVDDFPVDGSTYTANNDITMAPELVTSDGNFVVASGNGPATITGLTAGTTYHFRVFELNTSSNYSLAKGILPTVTNPRSVVQSVPSTQALDVTATGTGTLGQMFIKWTNGNGNGGRIVIMKTSAIGAPDLPVNGVTYADNLTFGSGQLIGGARVVYQEASGGSGGTSGITVTGLANNQQYFIKVLEFDGAVGAQSYNTANGVTLNPISHTTPTAAGPGTSASLLTYPGGTTTSIDLGWTAGTGSGGRIIVAKPTSTFVAADLPIDGVSYAANADYTLATSIGPNGSRVVYSDGIAGASQVLGPITVSGLSASSTYFFQVIEFNGTVGTGAENYRTNTLGNNPSSRSTVGTTAPSLQAFGATAVGNGTAGNLVIKWTNNGDGNGGRVVVLKPGSPFVGADDPVSGTSYAGSLNFGAATVVGPNGAKVVYREASGGTGGTTGITVTGLGNNNIYYIKVYEFDGTLATGLETYMTADGSANNPINHRTYHGTEPNDATNIVFGTITSSSVALTWTNGNYTGLTVTGASGDATNATLTFAAQTTPPFPVGSIIKVAAVNPVGYNAATATVISCTTTAVTYANTTVAAYVSGGNIQTGGRVLIVKPAADFVAGDRPVDGISYTYNGLNYGGGTAIAGAGSRVVYAEDYSGSGSSGVTVTGLTAGTSYRFFVAEFAGALGTGAENFNVTGGGNNSNNGQVALTLAGAPPSTQATAIVFTPNTTFDQLVFGWTNGNGANGRIAIIKPTNPIVLADEPVNGTSYTGNNDYSAAPTLGGAKVIYSDAIAGVGQATAPITVQNLLPNTLYYVKVYEFNGTPGTENYQTAAGASNNPNSSTTNIQPTTTYGVSSGTVGNAGIAANITVTFNVPVRFVNDAAITTLAEIQSFLHLQDNTTLANIPFTATINGGNTLITITPTDSNIAGNTMTGSRDYNVFLDVNEIETSQNVPLPASSQVVVATTLAEPTNQPTVPTISSTISSITIGWTDAVAGVQPPENYIIVGIENGGSFPTVVDLTDLAVDLDFVDGVIVAKVAPGVQTLTLNTNVKSGQPYDFRIYSYTNEAALINYKTTGFLTPSTTTGTGSATTVGNGGGTGSIASTVNDVVAAAAASANFTFDVDDDGATDPVDNAPTRITGMVIHRDGTNDETADWTDVIGGVILTDGTNSLNSNATPASFTFAANSITITNIPAALGLVGDNTTKSFQVKVWLQTSITGVDIDNKHIVMNIADGDFSVALVNSSSFTTTGTAASGNSNNSVDVVADRLAWTTPPPPQQAGTPFDFSVASTDVNANVDLDIAQQVTASVFSGPAGGSFHFAQATPVTAAQNLTAGRASWTNAKVTAGGTYTFRITDTDATSPAMALADAAGIVYTATNNASNVVENAGFTYPTNIDYTLNQANPVTAANGLRVAEFVIQDGGGAADVDEIGTTLTGITFTINNPGNIRRIGIHNGASIVSEQAAASSVVFSGLSLLAEDTDNGGTGLKTFAIYVTFNAPVVDNQHFDFLVTAVSTGNGGSRFLAGNGGGAQSSTTATNNKVVVTRSNLVFVTQPVNTYVNFPMTNVTVNAVDGLGSLDTDFIGSANVVSSGALTGTPVAATFSGGIGTYIGLVHTAVGAGFTLSTTNALLLTNGGSSSFNILAPDNTSDIQTDAAFVNTSDIAYETFQEASDIVVSATSIPFERFLLRDGAGSADADPLPTRLTGLTFSVTNSGYIRRAALYDGAVELAETTPSAGNVVFSAFNVSAADGTNKPLTLRVSFTTAVVDNQRPVFTVTNATFQAGFSGFAAANAGAAASSSTLTENQIEVFRSELRFVTQPVNTYVNFPMANVTVESTDVFGNRDLDFVGSANVTSSGSLTGSPVSTVFSSGLGTYVGLVHTVVGSPIQLSTTNALTLGNALSNTFSILAPNNQSDIVTNLPFSNPSDIAYDTFQENANIVISGTSIAVEEFNIRDGAGAADADPLETRLTALTLSINNPGYIRRAALYDGAVELAETTPVGSNLVFTAFSANTGDGLTKTLTLRVSFTTAVADNQRVIFTVTSASFNPGYSGFSTANAGGAVSTSTGTENQIEVLRTKVLFVQQPTTTYINTIMVPAVTVEAVDINNNRDLDFIGTINMTSSGALTGTPVPAVFAAGLGTYSTLTHTASAVGLQLTTTNALGMGNATSNAFTILPAANNSDIITNVAFANPTDIPYISIQENVDIAINANSIEVERFDIRDGGGVADVDPLVTTLTGITFSVSNPGFIRRAALYNGAVELAETTISGGNLVFTGFSVSATDDLSKTISLRVSYTTAVVDNLRNVFTVTSTTTQSGFSGFAAVNAGGAVSTSTGTENQIEVTATRLDFTAQQAAIQGLNQPINFPAAYSAAAPFIVVEARDANAIVDLDHNFAATVSSSNGALVRPNQVFGSNLTIGPGKLDLADPINGIQYGITGSAKLTVTSNGLTSNAPSIQSNIIDVIDVQAAYASQGVTPSQSLPGGSVDQTIFGFTLTAPYQIAGPEPQINGFTIQFGATITNVLTNPRLYESVDNIFSSPGAETNLSTSLNQVGEEYVVTFAGPRPVGRSYFLVVDIDPTASNVTNPITPALVDNGYSDPATNLHIVTTSGSATANVIGLTFNFAAIFPPLLSSSYPAKGQSNLDFTQPTLDMVFTVPVGSMDGIAKLYDQATDAFIADLPVLPSGLYPALAGTPANPLKFNFTVPLPVPHNVLAPNKAYYVTIAQGKNPTDGIRDQAGNLFAGISYSGTLFFKTSDQLPPAISLAPAPLPQAVGVTSSGATIGATFDKVGKAYYLVLATSPTDPTIAQIKNPATYPGFPGSVTASGNFNITKTKSIAQYGNFSANLATNTTYEVWMLADGTISKNGITTPIPATGSFGNSGNNFVAGTAGPTFTFLTPNAFTPGLNTNAPSYLVCKNATQDLSIPLVISETSNNNLNVGSQDFYLVLPANFNFNILTPGNISVSPAIGDVAGATISYVGSGILRVQYTVSGTSTVDVITISGLQVISSAVNASGPIIRIAGTGSIAAISSWGTVTTFDSTPISFDNSYSRVELANAPTNVVTTIPDNYDQALPDLPPFIVELIPPLPGTINDFGSNSFAGPGVNINRLSLSAVTLGAPFNIVLTHTDENGCVSTNSVQYTVYDHNTAITGLPTETCATSGAYLTPPVASVPQVTTVVYNNLGAYYMDSFTAKIPTQPARPGGGSYPFGIDDVAWNSLVSFDPLATGSTPLITRFGGVNPTDDQFATRIYYDYKFDNRTILDAATITTSGAFAGLPDLQDPYLYFRSTSPVQGHTYYTGGSLGFIEFNAVFQSIANSALRVPLRQNLQVFLPPVPIVEVDPPDNLDTTTPQGIYGGIPVFCVGGGTINIEGHPRSIGASTGIFRLFDAATNAVIYDATALPTPITPAGFTDNTNGTATLNPALLNHNYQNIRIEYFYIDDASVATSCGGKGSTVIRISPTPIASYALDQSAYAASNPDLIALGACENSLVTFDGTATNFGGIPGLPAYLDPKFKLSWDFVDANSSAATGNPNTALGTTATHTFTQSANYSVKLDATSTDGCASSSLNQTVRVGKVPQVNTVSQLPFTFTGTAKGVPFQFTPTTQITSPGPVGDGDLRHVWTWGDASANTTISVAPFTNPVPHTYSTPNRYFGATAPSIKVTSLIGCVASFSRPMIVLDQFDVDSLNVYREGFTTNANWQYWQTETATTPWNGVASSWAHGIPADVTAIVDPNDGNLNVWTTNLNGPYNSFERSALYTPSFNLSALKRPLITFNSIVQMESGDGVVVQYSTDNLNVTDPLKSWNVLGVVGGGVDWYNTSGLPSKPGDQLTGDLGFSGKQTSPVWVDSKYALADAGGNLIQGTNVVFRFAMASAKSISPGDGQGFVLDNVRIGERTRTILLESFTSTSNSNTDELTQNNAIALFNATSVGLEVVKLNYHLNFPAKDPFNELNPADPSSRALYYGVTQTPYSVLDGKNDGALWLDWGPNYFNTRSLQLAEADLKIFSSTNPADSSDVTGGGKVGIYVLVTPRVLGGLSPNTILHVGITEQKVPIGSLSQDWQTAIGTNGSKETQFEYVLKKLLPSAAGTRTSSHPNAVNGILQNGVKYVFGPFEYTPAPGTTFLPSIKDMAVAVFLQNELSRDIYQSEIIGDKDDPVVTITGLEPLASDEVIVFPNPANREMTVRFPGVLSKPAALSLIDQTGRTTLSTMAGEGLDRKILNVSELSTGVYILTVDMGQGVLTRKKVVVVHQD